MTWEEIYSSWQRYCESCGADSTGGFEFVPLQRNAPYSQRATVDWWPKGQVEERLSPPAGTGWYPTKAGTLHTAELLRDAQGNAEMQSAIFIAASLWDQTHNLPEHWRGKPFRFIEDTFYILTSELKIPRWHHSCREALPWNLNTLHITTPYSVDDLLYMVALEYAIVKANWQLVKFGAEPDESPKETAVGAANLHLVN